ncbi:uncharacterized protein LOC134253602 [Saccostrea cucullata]|uniref:uncharacterized protein LOC134253602 n=1 Tax=Saccostrea cuccullata TaxID=36930 RepID=UPI002ED24165
MKKSATDSTSTATIREISTRSSTACVQECLGNAYCVGVIYNRNSMKCHLQTRSNSAAVVKLETDSVFYDVQFENSVRKINPASCSEIKKCSSSSTDGEFWVFPDTYDRQTAIKTYCEGMTSPETASEYITLHYDNYSIRRDLNHGSRCYTKNTKNLMRTTFSKVKINVEASV